MHHPLRAIRTHALDFWMARTAVVVIIALQLWLGVDVAVGPIWLAPALEACLLVPLSIATAWAQDLAVKATHDHHWHLIARRRRAVRTMAVALTALITHHCHILETGNDSFRFKASSAATPKSRKEKSPA